MDTHKNIVILGRQPELSLLELEAVLGPASVIPFGREAALVAGALDLDRFGGLIKAGRVLFERPTGEPPSVEELAALVPSSGSKTVYGFSGYGGLEVRQLGKAVKEVLRASGRASRYVMPPAGQTALSAAQLKQGPVFELIMARAKGRVVYATATAVQDIEWYNERDYGRPARSAKVGMLPPKLAQILVNTTRSQSAFDPFCGTGVVLQEARLAGRRVWGSDLAEAMVTAARTNMQWLDGRRKGLAPWSVALADARDVHVPAGCAIVSEGYLGPPLERMAGSAQLTKVRREILALYRAFLRHVGKAQTSGDEVSICAPVWRTREGWVYLGIVDELDSLGYTLKRFEHVQLPLVYQRRGQKVGRQLLLLRKK